MDTEPSKIPTQLRELWKKLSLGRKIAAIGSVSLILAGVGYVSCRSPSIEYASLFSGLSPEDASQVVERLKGLGTPYRLEAGGTSVEVPRERVHEARISLASEGLPRGGGVGFEVFDKQSFATTSFVEQVNYRRAMQGELARTIAALGAVESARVHIALGERSVFKDADNPPSASVALRLRGGRSLNSAQVRGIVFLVASSIDGLTADQVVVVDDTGNVLSSGQDEINTDAQRDLEQTLALRVRRMIEKVVGVGHVSVVVTANMDFAKIERTEEVYDKGKPIIRSEVVTTERVNDGEAVGGVAGARGNLAGTAGADPNATGDKTRLAETRNYEVNRVVTHTKDPIARIKRLHVAVLVDHAPPQAEGEASRPRSKEEIDQIALIAREAAGIDTTRGDSIEVHSALFAAPLAAPEPVVDTPWPLPIPPQLVIPVAAGAGLLLVVIMLLLWRRRSRKRRAQELALPARVADVERAIDLQGSAEGLALAGAETKGLPEASVFSRVEQNVRNDAQRTARVLQGWLHQGNKRIAGGAR